MRATLVHIRSTKLGKPWAVLEGQWRGHCLRCVVVPSKWATVDLPTPGDGVVVCGKLWSHDGQGVIWVLTLTAISLA